MNILGDGQKNKQLKMDEVKTNNGPPSDQYGDPKYATVLPDYLDITMDYKIFRWLLIFVIILIVLAIIILAIVGVSTARNNAMIQPPPETVRFSSVLQNIDFTLVSQLFGLHDNPGATSADVQYRYINDGTGLKSPDLCSSVPYRRWNSTLGACECIAPFWGKYCERESFDQSNISFGHISPEVEESIVYLDKVEVNRQSFNFSASPSDQTTCDQVCSDNPNCVGYVLERTSPSLGTDTTDPTIMCKLLGPVESIPSFLVSGLTFDPEVDSNIFFRRNQLQRPKLPGYVFLFNGNLKRRFWLEQRVSTKYYNLVNLGIERLNHIHFYPENIINDDDAYIVFSYKHFTLSEAIAMIALYKQDGKVPFGWHVYSPGQNILNPPHSWTTDGGNFWVMAVAKETIQMEGLTSPVFKSREKLNTIIEELRHRTEPYGLISHDRHKGYDQTESEYDSLNPPEITGEYTGFVDDSSTSSSSWSSL